MYESFVLYSAAILFIFIVFVRGAMFLTTPRSTISVPTDIYISELERMRQIIKTWIHNERAVTQFIVESVSINADLLSNLKDINYKSVGLLNESDTFLSNLLRDTNELRSYSRFLDLYRKVYQEIDNTVLDTYVSRYFRMFTSDCIGEYKHTKKDMKVLLSTFPYLWLLEEIANILVEIDGVVVDTVVSTDMSKKLHTTGNVLNQDGKIS
jgi:hypothetical protein